jgi:hypothetical protein
MNAKKIQDARKCIFCGGGGLSKEHIWSAWISKVLPPQTNSFRTEGPTDLFDQGRKYTLSKIKKLGGVHTKKVRQVCVKCNNEWMSQIVQEAQPIAAELVSGRQVTLNEAEQAQVASWLVLAAMMANRITKSEYKFSKADLQYMFEHHRAPPHWYVGIGAYSGIEAVSFIQSVVPLVWTDVSNGNRIVEEVTIIISTIIWQLFAIVQVTLPKSKTQDNVSAVYQSHLAPLVPSAHRHLSSPSPDRPVLTGEFKANGGTAWEISQRLMTRDEAKNKAFASLYRGKTPYSS